MTESSTIFKIIKNTWGGGFHKSFNLIHHLSPSKNSMNFEFWQITLGHHKFNQGVASIVTAALDVVSVLKHMKTIFETYGKDINLANGFFSILIRK